jgi:hypothetical protein
MLSAAWHDYPGNVVILTCYCEEGLWPKRQAERLLVHTRTFPYGLLQKKIKQDRVFHVLRFVHLSDIKNEPDRIAENYDGLWKMKLFW